MEYALITGGSSGIGLEFSYQLAKQGYGLVIVSNRHDENIKAKNFIKDKVPVNIYLIDIDLTSPSAAQMIYDKIQQLKLEIEVLVSNAGILLFSTLTKTSLKNLDSIVALHCSTPLKLIRLFGEDMLKRRRGYILITSSATAWMPYPTISHYGATKAFLKNFSRSIWYEFRRYHVGVTCVFPGAVDTSLYQLSARKRKILRQLGIMQTPQQTASKALRKLFKNKYECIPGLFTKIIIILCRLTPVWIFLLILKIPFVKHILNRV